MIGYEREHPRKGSVVHKQGLGEILCFVKHMII